MSGIVIEHNTNGVFIIQIFVNSGPIFEGRGQRGLAHFLEHMMFKSKKDQSVASLLLNLNSLGGVFNAVTTKDYTSFYIRTIEKNWKESLVLLKKIVLEPSFLKEELDKERKVIIEEYKQYQDDIKDIVFTQAYRLFLAKDNPISRTVKGELRDIQRTSIKTLREYYLERYKNIFIYVNCSADIHPSVERKIQKLYKADFGNPSISCPIQCLKLRVYDQPVVKIMQDLKRSQNATVIMFQGFPYDDKQNIILEFVWNVLAGSLNSLLMLEMRQKRGLVYSISSFIDSFQHCGYTGIYFNTSTKDLCVVLKYIWKIFLRLSSNGLSDNVLNYSKASFANKLEYNLANLDFKSGRSMLRHYYGCKWDETCVLKKMRKVTNADVKSVCKEVFNVNRCCIVSVGKYDDAADVEKNVRRTLTGLL